MQFDRFDICEAYYSFAVCYGYDAYTSGIHKRLDHLQFRPSSSVANGPEGLSENGRMIFDRLALAHGYESWVS